MQPPRSAHVCCLPLLLLLPLAVPNAKQIAACIGTKTGGGKEVRLDASSARLNTLEQFDTWTQKQAGFSSRDQLFAQRQREERVPDSGDCNTLQTQSPPNLFAAVDPCDSSKVSFNMQELPVKKNLAKKKMTVCDHREVCQMG